MTLASLYVYVELGFVVPFVVASRTIRIRRRPELVTLTSLDAPAMFWSGFILCALPAVFERFGGSPTLFGAATVIALWFGFRITVRVTATRTRIIRRFAYVIPWRRTVHREEPRAFTDGWGDFADPEAINVALGDEGRAIELAWRDRWSGSRCDDLAADFNAAVATLPRPR